MLRGGHAARPRLSQYDDSSFPLVVFMEELAESAVFELTSNDTLDKGHFPPSLQWLPSCIQI